MLRLSTTTPGLEIEQAELGLVDFSIQVTAIGIRSVSKLKAFGNA